MQAVTDKIQIAHSIHLADSYNARIRSFDARSGSITTIAGNGDFGFAGDGGPARKASLSFPSGIVTDNDGNIFFADTLNHSVRRIDAASSIITTVAGNGTYGYTGDGGPATSAELGELGAVTLDSAGNVFLADGARIRRVDTATHVITTVAGNGMSGYGGDGGPAIRPPGGRCDCRSCPRSG